MNMTCGILVTTDRNYPVVVDVTQSCRKLSRSFPKTHFFLDTGEFKGVEFHGRTLQDRCSGGEGRLRHKGICRRGGERNKNGRGLKFHGDDSVRIKSVCGKIL